jgi:predicted small lipoprotein YifL
MTIRPAALFLIGVSIAVSADCGRKGPLELPPGRAPMPVEGLTAAPEDGGVRLTWTNPAKTVAGKPLGPLAVVEIWIFEKDPPAAGSAPPPEAVEKAARPLLKVFVDGRGETMSRAFRVPAGAKGLAFTVRVRDRKGRESAFSPVAVLPEREGA